MVECGTLLEISEAKARAALRVEQLLILSHAVQALAPDPADSMARIGLIHTALNRGFEALFAEEAAETKDCLAAQWGKMAKLQAVSSGDLTEDLARIHSLVFACVAGEMADPTEGAIFVTPHDEDVSPPEPMECCALLGRYVFFKNSAPFC